MVQSAPQVHEDPTYESNYYISLATAEYRDLHVADVAYKVDLSLPKGEWFGGKVEVSFRLLQKPVQDLFLDFRGVKIG